MENVTLRQYQEMYSEIKLKLDEYNKQLEKYSNLRFQEKVLERLKHGEIDETNLSDLERKNIKNYIEQNPGLNQLLECRKIIGIYNQTLTLMDKDLKKLSNKKERYDRGCEDENIVVFRRVKNN